MYRVSEYTAIEIFCVFVGVTFRKFSLYFIFFQGEVIASSLYLECYEMESNLSIHGRQKQLKQYICFKSRRCSTFKRKRTICIFQIACLNLFRLSSESIIILCNGRGLIVFCVCIFGYSNVHHLAYQVSVLFSVLCCPL